jgi:tripartite-type tricarboxylate transporter receptor subunit TctC
VPGYEAVASDGIGVPAGTPADIIAKLNDAFNAALTDPTIKARLEDLGGEPMPMSPAEFGKFIADNTAKWAKIVRFAHMKME